MGITNLDLNIELRDVKYDIGEIGVHGASYRQMNSDPKLRIGRSGEIAVVEGNPIHTAAFRVTDRKLNVVEAYGGLEDLCAIGSNLSVPINTGRLNFPQAKGAGGKQLPILVPIARVIVPSALVSIPFYSGTKPANVSAKARQNSVNVFVDWEMSHKSHQLLFDTPGYHLGIQADWVPTSDSLSHSGATFSLDNQSRTVLISALQLVVKFDQEFLRIALKRAMPNIVGSFVEMARRRYEEIDGVRWFGHAFNLAPFEAAMHMIGERVNAQPGLQIYYGLR